MKTIKKINYINSEEDTYGDTSLGEKLKEEEKN